MIFAEYIERVHAVIRGAALVTQRTELIGKQPAVNRVVIHHQDHHIFVLFGAGSGGRQHRLAARHIDINAVNAAQQRQKLMRRGNAVHPDARTALHWHPDMAAAEEDDPSALPLDAVFIVGNQDIVFIRRFAVMILYANIVAREQALQIFAQRRVAYRQPAALIGKPVDVGLRRQLRLPERNTNRKLAAHARLGID